MANKTILDLTEQTDFTSEFWIETVDPTDVTDSPSGTSKRMAGSEVVRFIGTGNIISSVAPELLYGTPTHSIITGYGTLSGQSCLAVGMGSSQSGQANILGGFYNEQTAQGSILSGGYSVQGGTYNLSSGYYNVQSGVRGATIGSYLNDGGFDRVFMAGNTVTAAVDEAAYFWFDNGVRLKPLGSDPATLEDGTMWITTAGDFKFRANGSTKTVTAT